MDDATRRWLLAQLGTTTDAADLYDRYTRLHSARAAAIEILRERLAALLAQPLRVTVSGVVTVDNSANVTALRAQIDALDSGRPPAPDDPAPEPDEPSTGGFGIMFMTRRPHR